MTKQRTPLTFYLLAISLLVVSTTLAYFLARKGLEERENDAKVVNLAGRQRMLSQRITKNCLKLPASPTDTTAGQAIKVELKRSLQEWELAHYQLHGITLIGDTRVENPIDIQVLLDSTQQSFQLILQAAYAILAGAPEPNQETIALILKNEPVFLTLMDEIVLLYQKESASKIKQLVQLETTIWVFTLILLCLELFFIFLPLNNHINLILKEKNGQNQLLVEKQEALESSLAVMQQMQQNLLEAEKLAMLGETVGIITHEINTPIGIAVTAASSLQEYTQNVNVLYQQDTLRKSSLESYLHHAEDGSNLILINLEKAAKLLQDFKDVAVRQLSGQEEIFDLKTLVEQVANMLGPYFKNTAIRLVLDLPEGLKIESHPGVFAQIIMNLVTNSLHHGFITEPKKGVIHIRFSQQDDQLQLVYSDDGVGIHPDLLPQIFEPFFSTNKQKGGSGLGLN